MKDSSSSKLNQYCTVHKYVHKETYELCGYCLEHKHYLYHKDKYCNYGFSKFKIAICKDRTTTKEEGEETTIEYFEAVRIAYLKNTRYFIEYFGDDDICQETLL